MQIMQDNVHKQGVKNLITEIKMSVNKNLYEQDLITEDMYNSAKSVLLKEYLQEFEEFEDRYWQYVLVVLE